MPKLPNIPDSEKTPLVLTLLEIIECQTEMITSFKNEIAELKGLKKKPEIKPSGIEEKTEKERSSGEVSLKRPGSANRSKTKDIEIHEVKEIKVSGLPEGSQFKGYRSFFVQGLKISNHNIEYRLERWQLPDGKSALTPPRSKP